jgi:uncharacterized protein with HEPN domain
MVRDHRLRLVDMLEAAKDAVRILGDSTLEQLAEDPIRQYALVRCFEIIGEAAKHVPPSIRAENQHIPFSLASRMRDRLSHANFAVDYGRVYDAISRDLPRMIEALEILIGSMPRDDS